jgi:Asp/Glu/hydantoin racemase
MKDVKLAKQCKSGENRKESWREKLRNHHQKLWVRSVLLGCAGFDDMQLTEWLSGLHDGDLRGVRTIEKWPYD